MSKNNPVVKVQKIAVEQSIKISETAIARTREANSFFITVADVILFINSVIKETFTRNFEFKEFFRQCFQIGYKSLPLISVTGLIMGMVLTIQSRPVLVDFGANSCAPCRQMRPILKAVGEEYSGKAGVLVIDIYKYQDLAREYKVQVIPTLVFFDGNGKEVFRHIGVLEKEKIIAKLKEIGMES